MNKYPRLHRLIFEPHKLPFKLRARILRLFDSIFERLLRRRKEVSYAGRKLFTMRNYSRTTRMRIESFASKEPETLEWIEQFCVDDCLLDVGANVGVYSLYAASRGIRVIAMEPEASNFALLNLNIADNSFGDFVTAYPLSAHNSLQCSDLNIGEHPWGGAESSFAGRTDWMGRTFVPKARQGSFGVPIDYLVELTGITINHLKIDVDGNEMSVLSGARETLAKPSTKSVLVELYDRHPEYDDCLRVLEQAGLLLERKVIPPAFKGTNLPFNQNHIFKRRAAD